MTCSPISTLADDGARRWLRAATFFAGCFVVAWATGVLSGVLTGSLTGNATWEDAGFVAATLGCVVLEIVAYGVIWARGTYVLDRPLDLSAQVPFGIAWGISEGLLLLSFWSVVDRTGWPSWVVVAVTFVVASAFQGAWHALYWDKYVAPEHNIPSWNLAKVLLCHVPNLIATLSFLAVYRAPVLFVGFQVIVLVLSTVVMRLPRPSRTAIATG